jgi:hypothetical protein
VTALELGLLMPRLMNIIKVDLKAIGCDNVDWINLAWYRVQWRFLASTLLNSRVP